jgi:hypothetical protein
MIFNARIKGLWPRDLLQDYNKALACVVSYRLPFLRSTSPLALTGAAPRQSHPSSLPVLDLIAPASPSLEPPFLAAPHRTSSPLQATRRSHPSSLHHVGPRRPCRPSLEPPFLAGHTLPRLVVSCPPPCLYCASPCGYYLHHRYLCAMPVSRSAAHTCSRRCEIFVFEIICVNLIRNLFIVHHRSSDPLVGFVAMTMCQVCSSIDCWTVLPDGATYLLVRAAVLSSYACMY